MNQGIPNRAVAAQLNIPRGTVGWWRSEDRKARGVVYEQPTDCPRCAAPATATRTTSARKASVALMDVHVGPKY
ncbi:hypothetical protein GCM10010310_34400 [Streptomyces violaceolatus]|uniref:Helix-turn-helix domain-containing protein n=1 Tax=Streptomyces violaceolatus TaxID=67378 RepID=A0ABN3SRB3_9ACTN|nr:hypothetical protein GCM10010391_21070 [Streptomyces anthocyanicus]